MPSKVQLPDLWLKMQMALSLVPAATPAVKLHNSALVRCIRGAQGTSSMYNKWLAGDDALSLADDGHFLSAMLETLLLKGAPDTWNHAAVKTYAETTTPLALEDALTGTIAQFGGALLKLIAKRADFIDRGGKPHFESILNNIARHNLLHSLDDCTEYAGAITVLHGVSRDWANSDSRSERLARKGALHEIPRGDFIQYLVPPASVDQLVFGFEIASEANIISADWDNLAGWFAPKVQYAGKALMLLDEPLEDHAAYRAGGEGDCAIQIVGVDLNHLSTTGKSAPANATPPHDLYRLLRNRPAGWPEGYAETIAMLTYVRRLAGLRIKVANKNELNTAQSRGAKLPAPEIKAVPPPVLLYHGSYRVV